MGLRFQQALSIPEPEALKHRHIIHSSSTHHCIVTHRAARHDTPDGPELGVRDDDRDVGEHHIPEHSRGIAPGKGAPTSFIL